MEWGFERLPVARLPVALRAVAVVARATVAAMEEPVAIQAAEKAVSVGLAQSPLQMEALVSLGRDRRCHAWRGRLHSPAATCAAPA